MAGIAQLREGVTALQNGIDSAAEGASALAGGIGQAKEAAQNLSQATTQLAQSSSADSISEQIATLMQLKENCEDETLKEQLGAVISNLESIKSSLETQQATAALIASGMNDLTSTLGSGEGQLGAGAASLAATLNEPLKNGAASVNEGMNQMELSLEAGVGRLSEGTGMLLGGEDGNGGAKALKSGMNALADGAQQVSDGSESLSENLKTAENGANTLKAGTISLASGAEELMNGSATLSTGLETLRQGSGELVEGVTKLDEGAGELHDGMIRFNEEGIEKLVSAFGGDTEELLDKLNDMLDASKKYKSFTGISDGMDGEVKFIFVMDK